MLPPETTVASRPVVEDEIKQYEARGVAAARAEHHQQHNAAAAGPRRSSRTPAQRKMAEHGVVLNPQDHMRRHDAGYMVAFSVADMNEPHTYTEAMAGAYIIIMETCNG